MRDPSHARESEPPGEALSVRRVGRVVGWFVTAAATVLGVVCLGVQIANLKEHTWLFTTPGYEEFWDDALAFHLKTPGHKTKEQLNQQYGGRVVYDYVLFPTLMISYLPSEKAAYVNLLVSELAPQNQKGGQAHVPFQGYSADLAIFAILFLYVPMLVATRTIARGMAAICGWTEKARQVRRSYFRHYPLAAYVVSGLIVAVISAWQAIDRMSPGLRALGVTTYSFWLALMVLACVSGVWSHLVSYAVGTSFVILRVNPKFTYWDEVIAILIAAPILYFVYQNSPIAIVNGMIAGLSVRIIAKTWLGYQERTLVRQARGSII